VHVWKLNKYIGSDHFLYPEGEMQTIMDNAVYEYIEDTPATLAIENDTFSQEDQDKGN